MQFALRSRKIPISHLCLSLCIAHYYCQHQHSKIRKCPDTKSELYTILRNDKQYFHHMLIGPCIILIVEKIDQLDVTCFIISLFTAQYVSNVSTSIFRSLRLIVDLFHVLCCSGSMCVGVTVWFGWGDVVSLCRPKH